MRTLAVRLFAPDAATGGGVLWPRWIFLRCLGLIFFSAFFSLAFQIQGLIGPRGILPAGEYLDEVAPLLPGLSRFYHVPSVLWIGAGHDGRWWRRQLLGPWAPGLERLPDGRIVTLPQERAESP